MVHPFIYFGGNYNIFVWKLVFKFLLAKYIPIGSIRLVWQNLNFEGKLENKNDKLRRKMSQSLFIDNKYTNQPVQSLLFAFVRL